MPYTWTTDAARAVANGDPVSNVASPIVLTDPTVAQSRKRTPPYGLISGASLGAIGAVALDLLLYSAIGAASGVIDILVGQQVLLCLQGAQWSVDPVAVARIGAIGGAIVMPVLAPICGAAKIRAARAAQLERLHKAVLFSLFAAVCAAAVSATAGAVGSAILDLHGESGISVGQASEAGIVGYAIVIAAGIAACIVMITLVLLFIALCGVCGCCVQLASTVQLLLHPRAV